MIESSETATRGAVCAAVVTYNRKDLLVECLDALLRQTHRLERIFVIDNASTDGTQELLRQRGLLDEERLEHVLLEHNSGGAGGYARAVEVSRALDVDWIWLMDDDAEPSPDTLARLLAAPPAGDEATAALCPAVVSPDGTLQLGARGTFHGRPRPLAQQAYVHGGHPELGFATFVGMLVRNSVARATAPPRADFFIWADDYEWCFRLRRHGSLRLVAEVSILHKDVGHGFETRRSRLINRFTPLSYGATPWSGFWRNIAGVRNYVWVKKTYLGESALGAVGTVAQFALKALLYDERPLMRIPWIVRAGIDGRLGVFQTITPQEWALRLRSEERAG
ncbi:MAG: glycosyl transferase, family 2 [uncultured Solirubrobacteraceae bacterium]|uniref:Glycosyl transferase, family 2 n=1 Tax=uncultured Solirubrobacteraceae bacterium TaxID=1162706 RepID=A0A6J4TRN0_9ACTN|nr:MAG: glycosyl transferase, family 2 [uncultured Solirubrobacteraceae bacterium]